MNVSTIDQVKFKVWSNAGNYWVRHDHHFHATYSSLSGLAKGLKRMRREYGNDVRFTVLAVTVQKLSPGDVDEIEGRCGP